MLIARTNETSYLKSLYLLLYHFFFGYEEPKPVSVAPRFHITSTTGHLVPIDLKTDEEEAGIDVHAANQMRRDLYDLEDHSDYYHIFYGH